MAVLEIDGKLLIIDCGVLFPEDHQPGVDLILPDVDYVADRLDDVLAVVLTHGHEDHIGAVPYLLRLTPDIPLLGPFECEFVAVDHSIPDALAVAVKTSARTVLHTGDFTMDQLPMNGRITDLWAFAGLGEEGVDLFVVDSTNAEVPGFTTAEREIGPVLDRVFSAAERRVVVASFASHVHRVQQVLDTAHAHGRKVALVGRSMLRNMGVAAELGYLTVPPGILVDAKQVDDLPDHQVVLMCTGSQGEPMAALSRMADNDDKVRIGEGDTVILGRRRSPGTRTRSTGSSTGSPGSAPPSCTRATPRCTSPATPPRGSSSTATPSCARAT